MLDDYEFEPFTVYAVDAFRKTLDASRSEEYRNAVIESLADHVEELDDESKGLVIIDLLTLLSAAEQAVTILQVRAIEEATNRGEA